MISAALVEGLRPLHHQSRHHHRRRQFLLLNLSYYPFNYPYSGVIRYPEWMNAKEIEMVVIPFLNQK